MRAGWLWGTLVAFVAGCSCATPTGIPDAGRDSGSLLDAAAVDAPDTSPDGALAPDGATDAGPTTIDAGGSDGATGSDAGTDARLADAGTDSAVVGTDAPNDSGNESDAGCIAWCDPTTGSYYTCMGGRLRCQCGPCAGDTLPCC